ncbi:MAG: hypothetical protein JRG94_09990 [Deltaproteobacteria bacterium]|nr:hypothetical protein [Deltaproteobacteria bacterium]
MLAPREVAFISSTAEVMFPVDGAIPFSGLEANLPGYADRFLSALEPRIRWQIRALFALFEHATLVFPAPGWTGFRRFSSLTFEQRELVLQGWFQSPQFIRQIVFVALRAVLTMGYLGHPVVMRHLRVAPYAIESPVCAADLLYPAIGAHPDQIPFTQSDITPASDGTPIDIEGPLHPDYLQRQAEGSLQRQAEGSLQRQAEGSLQRDAEGSLQRDAEGSLQRDAEGSSQNRAEGSSQRDTDSSEVVS